MCNLARAVNYPTINVDVDRIKAAQLGVDISEISRTLTASTSSSRYTEKNVWLDPKAGLSYAVQVQIPEK